MPSLASLSAQPTIAPEPNDWWSWLSRHAGNVAETVRQQPSLQTLGALLELTNEGFRGNLGPEWKIGAMVDAPGVGDAGSLESVLQKWRSQGVRVDVSRRANGTMSLDMLVVPTAERNKGLGSQVVQDLTTVADRNNARLVLTPSTPADAIGTTSQGRLKDFYKRFGFMENSGRNRDFSISDAMYRDPQGK